MYTKINGSHGFLMDKTTINRRKDKGLPVRKTVYIPCMEAEPGGCFTLIRKENRFIRVYPVFEESFPGDFTLQIRDAAPRPGKTPVPFDIYQKE